MRWYKFVTIAVHILLALATYHVYYLRIVVLVVVTVLFLINSDLPPHTYVERKKGLFTVWY